MSRVPADAADGPWAQSIRLTFASLFAGVGLLALAWATSNVRSVPPDARAVMFRFGVLEHVQGSGLAWAWPRPLGEVVMLPSSERSLELRVGDLEVPPTGRDATEQISRGGDPQDETLFLTGDGGVLHLEAEVFYRVTDAAAYLLARDPAALLRSVTLASAVSVAAQRNLDDILVTADSTGSSTSREHLRADLVHEANRRLASLETRGAGLGIDVTRIDLEAKLPEAARAAFDQVPIATQEADRDVARMRTDAETVRQMTQQEVDAIGNDAQAEAREAVSLARTRTAEVVAMAGAPAAGLDRLYFERIGRILGKAHQVDTVDAAGAKHLILPEASP